MSPIPDKLSVRLDPELRMRLAGLMTRLGTENVSEAVRTAIAIGLRDADQSPDHALQAAGYRAAVMQGVAKIRAHLGKMVESVLSELGAESGVPVQPPERAADGSAT